MHGVAPGIFDLRWDDPAQLSLNSKFAICGVNVYRSFDSEFGPYERVTALPVGCTFWRDQTDNVLIPEESIGDDQWVLRGVCEDASEPSEPHRYVLRTLHCPIVKPGSQGITTDDPNDVMVFVDGERAPIRRLNGFTGEIELDTSSFVNVATQKGDPAIVPELTSRVTVAYRFGRTLVETELSQRIFYRVTAVGIPVEFDVGKIQPQDLVETALERAAATSSLEVEKLDWIWREAVRRNQWILNQGGERVQAFIRKKVGTACGCTADYGTGHTHKQPLNDCLECFGTGIVGGFEGPYDIIVAPDDAERRISQKDIGRTVEHSYEVWTGPSPVLSQRDFVVKINGERYSIGAVRMPTNRGMVLQQHFMIGHIDEQDIRYKVPIDNPFLLAPNRVRLARPPNYSPAGITDKPAIPDEREQRGRTVTWENIQH